MPTLQRLAARLALLELRAGWAALSGGGVEMSIVYVLYACTAYEGGTAVKAWRNKVEAENCRDACNLHLLMQPKSIPDSTDNQAAWDRYFAADDEWRAKILWAAVPATPATPATPSRSMNWSWCHDLIQVAGECEMNDLMTLEDIAEMHRCSTRHARDVIVRLPEFPVEAPTSTPRKRLWLRSEVRAFIHRKPARIPFAGLKAA